MFCHKCGNQLPEDSGFCPKCGAKMMYADTAPHTLGTPVKTSEPREASVAAKSTLPYTQNAQADTPKKKKLGKLPIFLGAAMLVIVLIIVVASMGNDSQQTSSSSNTGGVNLSETYTNEAEGISFKYPSTWEPIGAEEIKNYYTEAKSENIVVFLANETKDVSELNSYIEVLKFPSSQADIDHLWITDEEFKETFADDVSITKTSVIQLDGVPTRMITFATSEDIIYRSYFYGVDSNLYRVNFIRKGKVSANDERFFDAVIDSYTIAADDKSGKNGVESPSTNEMLYKGQPIVPLIGSTPEELNKIFGAPTGGTPVTGELLFGATEYYIYGGISFILGDQGTAVNITVGADAAEMNGIALNQNRAGIINLLGTPGYEEQLPEDESGEGFGDYYIMEYTSYEDLIIITVQLPDADSKANNITIARYDDGPGEEYQESSNDTAATNVPPAQVDAALYGRWVADNGNRIELFEDGTGTSNLSLWDYIPGSTIWTMGSERDIEWQAENGRLILAARSTTEKKYSLTNEVLSWEGASVSYRRKEGDPGSDLYGSWMPTVGGGSGIIFNQDGTGYDQTIIEPSNFTWHITDDNVLVREYVYAYNWDYSVSGNMLTLFGTNSSTYYTRVGG